LRAWESRYRLLRPSRTAGGQRLYSADDEARVQTVVRMVAEGSAVGAAARWVASAAATGQVTEDSADTESGQPDSNYAAANLEARQGAQAPYRAARAAGAAVAARNPPGRLSSSKGENETLAVIHRTTRAIVHAATPADVVAVLAGFVRQTGASLVDAQIDEAVLPVDLSFGEGPPLLPRAEPFSVARLTLEEALPALVEDARRLIDLLRRAEIGRSGQTLS
jgi:hypothetical protein